MPIQGNLRCTKSSEPVRCSDSVPGSAGALRQRSMPEETPQHPKPKKRGPFRRLLRIIGFTLKTVIRVVEGVLLLLALVIGFIHTQPGRNLVASIVESKVSDAIQGEVTIGRLSSVNLFGITIEDIALSDPDGRPVLEIDEVSADWDLLDIIGGEIEVVRVAVVNPRVGLWLEENGQYSLLSAIAPTSPSSEPPEPEEPSGEPTPIRVRHFSLSGGAVVTDDPRARGLSVSGLEILAHVDVEGDVVVDLEYLAVGIDDPNGRLIDLWLPGAVLQAGDALSAETGLAIASAGDLISAELTFQSTPEQEPIISAHVELAPVTGLLLDSLGFEDLQSSIPQWVRGRIDATGPLSEIDISIDLETPGGSVALTATVSDFEDIRLSTASEGLDLQAVSSMLPEQEVSWDLEIEVNTDEEGRRNIVLDLAGASFGDLDIPAITIDAVLDDDGVSLERFALPHLGNQVEISGRYDFGGGIVADIEIDDLDLGDEPRLESLLQGSTGIVDASIHARLDPVDDMEIDANLSLSLQEIHAPGVDVDVLTVSGSADGPLLSPEVDLDIHIERLLAGANGIDRADIHLLGPVGSYDLDGEVQITDGPLVSLDVTATIDDDVYEVNGEIGASMEGETVALVLDGVRFEDGDTVRVAQLAVTHTDAQVFVSGTYELSGQAALLINIPRVDLGMFDGRFYLPDLPVDGDVSARLDLSGDLENPNVDLSLGWSHGEVAGLSDASASIVVTLLGREFSSTGDIDLGDDLTAHWDARTTLASGDLAAGFMGANWDLTLNTSSSSLEWLEDLIGELPAPSETSAESTRFLLSESNFAVELSLDGRRFSSSGDIEFGTDLTAHWDARSTLARGQLIDGFMGAEWDVTLTANVPTLVWLEDLMGEVPILSEVSSESGQSLLSESSISVEVGLESRRFSSTGDVQVGPDLTAHWDASSTLSSGGDIVAGLLGADWDVTLDVNAQAMDWLGSLGDDLPAVADSITASVVASGTLAGPELMVALDVHNLEADAVEGAIDITARIDVGSNESALDIEVNGADGRLVSLDASAQFGSTALMEGTFDPVSVLDGEWQLELQAPRRDISGFGLALGALAEYPVEVDIDVSLRHAASEPITGWVRANAEIGPPENTVSALGCFLRDRLLTSIEAEMADGSTDLLVTGVLNNREVVRLDVSTGAILAEIDALLDGSFPIFDGEMVINQLDLTRMPLVCDVATGTLDADLTFVDIFGSAPRVDLRFEGADVSYDGAEPVDLVTTVALSTTVLDATVWVSAGDRGVIEFATLVPLVWGGDHNVPELTEEPLVAVVSIVDFPTGPLAPFVDPLRRGRGRLNGRISVEGPSDALVPEGEIRLQGLEVIVPGLEQRLTEVNGTFQISPDRINIRDLTAVDRGGTIALNGSVSLTDLVPTRADITFEASEFPMRQAGSEVAQLTVIGEMAATLSPELRTVNVTLREIAVWLAEESAGGSQSLETNPDIVLVDEAGLAETAEIAEVVEATSAVPLHIVIDASSPFWVRKSGLSVQLSAELEVDVDDAGTRISGVVNLRRGTVALMGKEFSLEPGTIIFDGGQQLDPLVDLVAIHELSRYPGETVTVLITGRLSRPQLAFECTVEGVSTETEIVQLLATGRVSGDQGEDDGDIGDQVASMLSGITAGVLMVAGRNALGDAMPLISVETGADLSEVQIRAGFVVDSLIPDFLEGIVTGMYVEGVFEAGGEEEGATTNRSAFGGLLLELYFDNGWLTSSSFKPPANWSVDVLWRP